MSASTLDAYFIDLTIPFGKCEDAKLHIFNKRILQCPKCGYYAILNQKAAEHLLANHKKA